MAFAHLHVHTQYSLLDGVCRIDKLAARLHELGQSAIAITDHGVAQSFPDAWHSAKKIKILYGVEAYFINDVDDRVAVHGETDAPFNSEIVCFDIETTGLNKKHEVIIEIGAVKLSGGQDNRKVLFLCCLPRQAQRRDHRDHGHYRRYAARRARH